MKTWTESMSQSDSGLRRGQLALTRWDARAWLNGPHSKCGIGASLSGVRILFPPPMNDIMAI